MEGLEQEQAPVGEFESSLKLNGREIRDKRSKSLAEDAEMAYKTKVDRLLYDIRRLVREQEDCLDLSPDNVFSFISPKDFDSEKFAEEDSKLAYTLRNARVKFVTAARRYKKLFGKTIENVPADLRILIDQEGEI